MAEVAANIESKVSIDEYRAAIEDRITRSELSMRMQEKVSFEDMKRFVSLSNHNGSTDGQGVSGG